MCTAICYVLNQQNHIINFSDEAAKLPVFTRDGLKLILWGRRTKDQGVLPYGGCLRQDALEAGEFDKHFPKRVKVSAKNFQMHDVNSDTHWFMVTEGHWLEGIILTDNNERRLYLLMITIPTNSKSSIYPYWPSFIVGIH